jgi:hypothetical protein
MVARQCIAWNKAHGDTWDRMLVSWSDADINAAIAGAKAPAVGNEVEAAGSAGEAGEDAGADGAVAEAGEEAGGMGGEAVEDTDTDAVADADGEGTGVTDGATSSGEVEIIGKGKAKAEEAGGSDDNEDAGEGGHNDNDNAIADRPPRTRKAIAYDLLDVRSFQELDIVVPPVLVKSRAPRPLRMTVVKADPVDGSFVVSLWIHFFIFLLLFCVWADWIIVRCMILHASGARIASSTAAALLGSPAASAVTTRPVARSPRRSVEACPRRRHRLR